MWSTKLHKQTLLSPSSYKSAFLTLVFLNSTLKTNLVSYYNLMHIFTTTLGSFTTTPLLGRRALPYLKFLIMPRKKKFPEHALQYLPQTCSFSKQFFKHYIKLGLYIPSEAYSIHSSYAAYYLYNSGKNLGFINIKWFFRVWSLFIAFLENIFYYKVPLLSFSNPYLKEESLALSWGYLQFFKNQWRLSNLFYLFTNNKNLPDVTRFFKMLKLKNFNLALVTDVTYHQSTVHCLHVNSFTTVGPLPLTMSLYSLSFSLPVTANNFVSNLFFLRLVLKLKSMSSYSFFNKRKLHWKV